MAIKDTVNEIKQIITELKAKVDNNQTWGGEDEKKTMEARIAHLQSKKKPAGTVTLDTDLNDINKLKNTADNNAGGADANKTATPITGLGFKLIGFLNT